MPAQMLAQTRQGAAGALFFSAALPASEFGSWPDGVPLQIHMMEDDPWGEEDLPAARALVADVDRAELFLYPGNGHLFADGSLADYDESAATALTGRAVAFLEDVDRRLRAGLAPCRRARRPTTAASCGWRSTAPVRRLHLQLPRLPAPNGSAFGMQAAFRPIRSRSPAATATTCASPTRRTRRSTSSTSAPSAGRGGLRHGAERAGLRRRRRRRVRGLRFPAADGVRLRTRGGIRGSGCRSRSPSMRPSSGGTRGSRSTREGRYAEAADRGLALLETRPDQPYLFYNVACCESLAGRTADAIAHLGRAIEMWDGCRDLAERTATSTRSAPRRLPGALARLNLVARAVVRKTPATGLEGRSDGGDDAPRSTRGVVEDDLSRWLWLVKWLLAILHFVILAFLGLAALVVGVIAFFAILFTTRYPRSLFDFTLGVMRWTWRVVFYSYGALGTERYPPFTLGPAPDYPATLDIAYPEQLSRGLVLVKWWLLAIPQYLVVGLLVGARRSLRRLGRRRGVVELGRRPRPDRVPRRLRGLALLFVGRYPLGIFDFVLGLDRWVARVIAYVSLMTDEYPPFRLDQGGAERAAVGEPQPGEPRPPPEARPT